MVSNTYWVIFNTFIILFLMFDLGVLNKNDVPPTSKQALNFTIFWIFISLIFGVWIYFHFGTEAFFQYITSYKIEKFLSIDNVMVFAVIFKSFNVPIKYQHRVLFIGIISALVLRGLMIFLGIELLLKFHWLLTIFGIFLIFTGIKIFAAKEKDNSFTDGMIWRYFQKIIPNTAKFDGHKFFIKNKGKLSATPLFYSLILIEVSDIIFAIDSLPAIFSITTDPFLIYTSNMLAILGLRSLYFVLANAVEKFKYLKPSLGIVLIFVGAKIVFNVHLHPAITFSILGVIFSTAILLSIRSKS
jgi:tellurite resistance protein TerC